MRLDLHCHSCYSKDGATKPKNLVKVSKEKGLVVSLTDHDNCNGWKEAKRWSKEFSQPIILGEEIKVRWSGDSGLAGELIGLFLQEPIKSHNVLEVIDEIHSQGALCIVAHPFDSKRKPWITKFERLEEIAKKVDAVEAFNSRNFLEKHNKLASEFASSNNLPITAGSDAHFPFEIGNAFIVVEADSLEEARKKILKGKVGVQGKRINPIFHSCLSILSRSGLLKLWK